MFFSEFTPPKRRELKLKSPHHQKIQDDPAFLVKNELVTMGFSDPRNKNCLGARTMP